MGKSRLIPIVCILLVSILPIANQESYDYEQTVLRINDLVMSLNEVYETDIVVHQKTLHSIEVESNPSDPQIMNPVVTIDIDSDIDGKIIFHRGDVEYSVRNWTPATTGYHIEIKNNGYIDNLSVSLVIMQIEPAEVESVAPISRFAGILISIAMLTIIPPFAIAVSLQFHRRSARKSLQD